MATTEREDDSLKSLTGNLWDRLEEESHSKFDLFKTYRDLGPTRTVAQVARDLNKSRPLLATYSSRYSWVLRAAAWDAEQDRLDQQWMAEERKKAAKRHVRQAQSLASKWITRLQTLDPSELSPGEVIRYAEIATKMERDALRMQEPDTVVNVNLPNVEALNVEDTRLRLEAIQREIQTRLSEE